MALSKKIFVAPTKRDRRIPWPIVKRQMLFVAHAKISWFTWWLNERAEVFAKRLLDSLESLKENRSVSNMERKKAKEEKDKSKQRTLFPCFQRKIETPKENSNARWRFILQTVTALNNSKAFAWIGSKKCSWPIQKLQILFVAHYEALNIFGGPGLHPPPPIISTLWHIP